MKKINIIKCGHCGKFVKHDPPWYYASDPPSYLDLDPPEQYVVCEKCYFEYKKPKGVSVVVQKPRGFFCADTTGLHPTFQQKYIRRVKDKNETN